MHADCGLCKIMEKSMAQLHMQIMTPGRNSRQEPLLHGMDVCVTGTTT